MNGKLCRTVAVVALVVAVIGLLAFVGGVRSVNIGAFVFPLLVSGVFYWLSAKK